MTTRILLSLFLTILICSVIDPEPSYALNPEWQYLNSIQDNQIVPPPNTSTTKTEQTASQIFDIDGDGINDFVIAERTQSPSVVWYQRTSAGWQRRIIDDSIQYIEAGGAHADIDGDGDLDLVFAGDYRSNQIWWWENPAPNFDSTWTRRLVKDAGATKHHDQLFADIDNDNQVELISWNQDQNGALLLFEIPNDPKQTQPWSATTIASNLTPQAEGLTAADVDGDGQTDIIGAGRWWKHAGGTNFTENAIDNSQLFTRSAVGQLIPGGYSEVLFQPGDADGPLIMYQWDGTRWNSQILIESVIHGHSLAIVDINNDQHLDIFSAEMNLNDTNPTAKTRVLYGDSTGQFEIQVIANNIGNHESRIADLDGDGDFDILNKPYNWQTPRLGVWLNQLTTVPPIQPASLDEWQTIQIGEYDTPAVFVESADIDGDHQPDIVAGRYWWKNPGQPTGSWQRQTIGGQFNMATLYDFDQDGDIDIFGTIGDPVNSNDLAWAQNQGNGNFEIKTNIDPTIGNNQYVTGDFLQGIVVQPGNPTHIYLSWHLAGKGITQITVPSNSDNPWTATKIYSLDSFEAQSEDLSLGNIDQSGGLDLLLGLQWLQNNGVNWTIRDLATLQGLAGSDISADRNQLADIDGDGRLDAVVAFENGTDLVWYKNPQTSTEANWVRTFIARDIAGQGFSLDTADIDGDGDIDIVLGEHRNPTNNRVIIYENTQSGAVWIPHVVASQPSNQADHHDGTQFADIDKDGDLDIVSIGWNNRKVWLYQNNNPVQVTRPLQPGSPRQVLTSYGQTIDQIQINSLYLVRNYFGTIAPTNTPIPTTNSGTDQEVKIFDQSGLSFGQTGTDGFLPLIKNDVAGDEGIPNWISPVDYWNGQFQVRYSIENHPTGKAGILQTCIWNMSNWDYKPETCSGYAPFSQAGDVNYNPDVYPNNGSWFRHEGVVDFAHPETFLVRVVLREASGCNVMPYVGSDVCGPNFGTAFAPYRDMTFRATIVLVPAGQEFSGWENYP